MEQIPVQFEAREAGRGAPTWGQKELWGVGGHEGRHVTFGGAAAMPPGIGLEAVVGSLEYLAGRHQTLRTRFTIDSRQRLHEQILHARGEIPLLVVDADDPELAAQETAIAFDQKPFDGEAEWPLRMAVIRKDKELTHTVAVYNHLALDGRGLDLLLADLLGGGAAGTAPGAPADVLEPLQQAAWQTSVAGRRQTARALKHWERVLRAVPARRFPQRPADPGAPYLKLLFSSPAADLAAAAVARRTRQSTGHILLAAYAIAVERMSRVNPTVLRVVVDNRFRPGLADSVSAVSQFGLCAIDVRDADFDTVLARTMRASLDAYMNAYYDPEERQNLIEVLERERGEPVVLDSCYNDRRRGGPGATGDNAELDRPIPSAAALREAAGGSVLRSEPWTAPTVPVGESLYIHIDDEPGRIVFTLCGDSTYLTTEDLEHCVRSIEEVLVAAALR